MGLLDGKSAIITGSARGIGRATAELFVAEGAKVLINDLDADAAERVATEIGGFAVAGDAASEDGVEALVTAARVHLDSIDAYFANAGIDVRKLRSRSVRRILFFGLLLQQVFIFCTARVPAGGEEALAQPPAPVVALVLCLRSSCCSTSLHWAG